MQYSECSTVIYFVTNDIVEDPLLLLWTEHNFLDQISIPLKGNIYAKHNINQKKNYTRVVPYLWFFP
jgi:hypothetical protein